MCVCLVLLTKGELHSFVIVSYECVCVCVCASLVLLTKGELHSFVIVYSERESVCVLVYCEREREREKTLLV